MTDALDAAASPFTVNKLTGRLVTLRDPTGTHPLLQRQTVAYEVSTNEWQGRVLWHVCTLSDGGPIKIPPAWVSPCPDNVVMLGRRP